jgi:hypothetical protein
LAAESASSAENRKKSRLSFRDERQFALVDQVGVGDDLRIGGLAEDARQARDRHHAAGDQVAQYVARANRGQLVHVPDKKYLRAGRHGLEQVVGQEQVEHRGLVHHQVVDVERVVLIALEAEGRGGFEQAVDGAGRVAGGFGEALGGPPGGGGQGDALTPSLECANQRFQAGGFSRARPARQHADRILKRHPHRGTLFVGQVVVEEGGLHRPFGGFGQGFQAFADALLAKVERGQVDDRVAGVNGPGFGNARFVRARRRVEWHQFGADTFFSRQALEGGRNQIRADAQQFDGAFGEHLARSVDVAIVDQFIQRKNDPGFDPRRVFGRQVFVDVFLFSATPLKGFLVNNEVEFET